MSTLRTNNLQNPDSSNVNIELTQNGGAVVSGIVTASAGIEGNLTGNLVGNVTGNATGITTTQITVGDTFLKESSIGIGTTTTNVGINTALGTLILNTTDNNVQIYGPEGWTAITSLVVSGLTATGGVVNEYEDSGSTYRSHLFTSSGTFEVTELSESLSNNIDYLVVAGGGGGGLHNAGGGGGGEVKIGSFAGAVTTYPITIGAGGRSGYVGNPGSNGLTGGTTTLGGPNPISSAGGEGGRTAQITQPNNGGGGNSGQYPSTSNGAGGNMSLSAQGGGGGGAGTPGNGSTGSASGGGPGGDGVASAIDGTSYYYGGGGGGSNYNGPTHAPPAGVGGTGGLGGGGGGGGAGPNVNPTPAPGGPGRNPGEASEPGSIDLGGRGGASTGGGGGGTNRPNINNGAEGGSGVVIVRYKIGETQTGTAKATGGDISFYNGKTIHKFTSSSSFVTPASFNETVDYVVIGGGGGGVRDIGGGGGAGAWREGSTPIAGSGTHTVTVGAGGRANYDAPTRSYQDGGSSSIQFPSVITAAGGGGGGSPGSAPNDAGRPGGSGGGGRANRASAGGTGSGDPYPGSGPQVSPANGWGNDGSGASPGNPGGGGGGAGKGGGPGSSGGTQNSGGDGLRLPATYRNPQETIGYPGPGGTTGWFAGGGGAAGWPGNPPGGGGGAPGGSSYAGAGAGGAEPPAGPDGGNAGVNSGSGGGGGGNINNGGKGGSGFVIISYPT